MQEPAQTTHETTESSGGTGGFPPFKTQTYPSQLFWLTITFVFLFVFLWRFAGPRIHNSIAERRKLINSQIGDAEKDRKDAESALATYQNTLVEARQRAHNLVEETRAKVVQEAERAEEAADTEAQEAISKAEARLNELRAAAKKEINRAAQDAAIDIVARLTGETVSADEAAAAVNAVQG
jgi:F-type H+-transporting ATPase subunit b